MIPASVETLIARSDDVRLSCLADRLYTLPKPVQRELGNLVANRLRIGNLAGRVVPATEIAIVDAVIRVAEVAAGREIPSAACSATCSTRTCVRTAAT